MKKTTEQFIKEIYFYITENGLENVSIRDICDNLNISTGCLYYKFKSKEGLVISVGNYGFNKIIDELFSYTVSTISKPEEFFESFLEFVKLRQDEFRLICQIATSPVYGNEMRKLINVKDARYERYIQRLVNVLRISKEEFIPILYMVLSIMLCYVVSDNCLVSQMQMNTLYKLMSEKKLIK